MSKENKEIETHVSEIEVENASETKVENIGSRQAKHVVEKKKREFRDSDYILCRSVCPGGLNVTCKSGGYYEFREYGAECDIEYRDLIYLVRKNSEHIFAPRFVILDEDFLDEFPRIRNLYASMYTPAQLLEIIDLPVPQMKAEIEKLTESTKKTLVSLVATEVARGRLDSLKKIKALSDIFNSDFNLLSELFNK